MRKKIAEVWVDSGHIWVSDPCYVIHQKDNQFVGDTWEEFVKKLDFESHVTKFDHGFGICVGTMYGDGVYPVYGNYNPKGELTSITIKL